MVDEHLEKLRTVAFELAIACMALVMAYKNADHEGGSINWEDLDNAHALALDALIKAGVEKEGAA